MSQQNSVYAPNSLNKKENIIYLSSLSILFFVAIFIYGIHVLWIGLVAYIVSILVELLFSKIRKTSMGYGFMVTPMLFTLILPPTLPLWIVGVGAFFGTFFGKSLFGGDGKNIFPPAIVGVLFITISFPAFLNTMWLDPVTGNILTGTPVNFITALTFESSFNDLLLGQTAGPLGVTFRIGVIVVGTALAILKIIDWRVTVSYLVSFVLFTFLFSVLAPDTSRDAILSLFVGSVLFAAFFLATDRAVAPKSVKSIILYGLGLGLITVIIRHFAAFPEGVIFALIIMSAFSPLIEDMFEKDKGVIANE